MRTISKSGVFFVIDVESIGLHGEAFAVAGGIYRGAGAPQEEFLFACPPDRCRGIRGDRLWIKENVRLPEPTHPSPRAMRDAFWECWVQIRRDGAMMVADCAWPVEARFLCQCIDDAPEKRSWEGPYPLLDVASILWVAGMEPPGDYERLPAESPAHCPLADSRHSARLLREALHKLGCCIL